MARLFPWGQIRRVLLPGCGLRVVQLRFQPALVFLGQWTARKAVVSCEFASDVARAITARSGALPGEMKALLWRSLQRLPSLGSVQVLMDLTAVIKDSPGTIPACSGPHL